MIKLLLFVTVALFVFLQGCSYRNTYFPTMTIAGPEIQQDSFKPSDYQMVDKNVISTDMYPIIIVFPILGNNQKLYPGMIDNAVQKICKEKNFAFLTNVRIYDESWYIPYIFGKIKFTVKCEGWSTTQKSEIIDELKADGFTVAAAN